MDNTSIEDILCEAETVLKDAGICCSRNDAELIVADILDLPRLELAFNKDRRLPPSTSDRIHQLVRKRAGHYPLQYILKKAHFRNLTLEIGPAVLIPRPETELMLDHLSPFLTAGKILADIGTGSGAIALSVASEHPEVTVIASDISREALMVARHNRDRYGLPNVSLLQSDLLSAFKGSSLDIITANLPYISAAEMSRLPREIIDFEPSLALYGGDDGLDCIRRLIDQATTVLRADGIIILEIGSEQGGAVSACFSRHDCFSDITVRRDLNDLDRFVYAMKC